MDPPPSSDPTYTPASRGRRAQSFGVVADEYDRYRPSPPQAALDWLLPERVSAVLDLGAGTGALSRKLLPRADEVLAVEPDARMRTVLARRLPHVRLLAGRAEELPLPDASVDAVLIASAWHWVDPQAAVPEIARVLRPSGVLGILWTGLDRSSGLGASLWEAVRELMPGRAAAGERHRPEDVRLPAGSPFGAPEIRRLRSPWRVSPQRLAGTFGTYSSIITLPEPQRQRLLARVRHLVAEDPALAGRERVTVALSCRCWKARRL
jgi:SAM-dependent methyltransferase